MHVVGGAKGQLGRQVAVAFHGGPAVVAAGLNLVDFVVVAGAVLRAVDAAVGQAYQALGVAVAQSIERAAGAGVVGRNGAVEVQAQDFTVEGGPVLGFGLQLGVAGGHEQREVGQDKQARTAVRGGGRNVAQQHQRRAERARGGRIRVAHQLFLERARVGVVIHHVHEGRGGKLRVQGHAQQSTLAHRGHVGQREERQYLPRGRVHPADATVALGHPDKIVGAPHQLPHHFQVGGHGSGRNRGGAHGERGEGRGLGAGHQGQPPGPQGQ